jgi:hypothetical protein
MGTFYESINIVQLCNDILSVFHAGRVDNNQVHRLFNSIYGLDNRTKMLFNLPLWERSDQFVYLPAVLEEKQGGNALNTILRGRCRVVIRIQLGDLDSADVFGGQLVHDGGHHTAGAAPGRPAIHKDWSGKREYFLFEGSVRNFNRVSG